MWRLGKQCRQQYAPEGRVKDIMKKAIGGTGPIFKANPTGGSTCGRSGDQGRVGIHELMITSEKFVGAIDKRRDIRAEAHCPAAGHEDPPPGQHAEGEGRGLHVPGGDRHRAARPVLMPLFPCARPAPRKVSA